MARAKESRQRILTQRIVQLVLTAVIVAGCSKGTSTAAVGPRPTGWFGDNGAATLNYVNRLGFTGAGSLISKFDCATCPDGKILLLIIPETGANNRNWQADVVANNPGDVVAQVINIDTVAFPELSLDTGEVAYAWVGQIGANPNDRGFGVYKLNADGTRAATRWVTPKTQMKFCPHDDPQPAPRIKTKHEGTGPCNYFTALPAAGKNRLGWLGVSPAYGAAAPSVSTAFVGIGGLWITCSGGCCQISMT